MQIRFYKYHGAGNDFVIADNREGELSDIESEQIRQICSRRYGIGSDGLILLSSHDVHDFKMDFYNPDGSGATFCGNGARCITAFACEMGIFCKETTFLAADGLHKAQILDKNDTGKWLIRVQMRDVPLPSYDRDFSFCDTGSPHVVKYTDDADKVALHIQGPKIRYDKRFGESGTNVNFVQEVDARTIKMRTYERGVESETHSCGTGVTASAVIQAYKHQIRKAKIKVSTRGGNFSVSFRKEGDLYKDIWLEGQVQFVYEGIMTL